MSIDQNLFIYIPLAALLLNGFLFLTCLSAKKNALIFSFLALLLSFTAWSAGSVFMRLMLTPGVQFWYEVSIVGIFSTPLTYYTFVYYFTGRKGGFLRSIVQISWVVLIVLAVQDVFMAHPVVYYKDGGMVFDYDFSNWVYLAAAAVLITALLAIKIMYNSVKADGVPVKKYIPLILSIIVLCVGLGADALGIKSFPSDALACGINALLIYYALYKNRIVTLVHITSDSPTFLISAIFTTTVLGVTYPGMERFYERAFSDFIEYKTVAIAVVFSIMTIIIFTIVRKLISNLFVKNIDMQESELKTFSKAINKTLDLDEILQIYKNFIMSNFSAKNAYICIYDEKTKLYKAVEYTAAMSQRKIFSLRADNPMTVWLRHTGQVIIYSDFQRTNGYKAMWESEKKLLAELDAKIILPILSDDDLTGITLFTEKERRKKYTPPEINFMESASVIVSIAMKNAALYNKMQMESQRDSLTDLYNRRFFLQKVRQDFGLVKSDMLTIVLINFDDFRLYNELYGAHEGDYILKRFADILLAIVKDEGVVARFGGKEFMISLPFYDADKANELIDRIRERLQQALESIVDRGKRYLTFSAGICEYPTSASNVDELLTYVNMAVYTAKHNGKNRVEIYSHRVLDKVEQMRLDTQSKKQVAENCEPTILALTAAIDAKDHYTFNHSNNVSEYAAILAKEISLDSVHVEIIRQAGLMHDIGKIGIPDAILAKKSKLTEEEYEVVKQHVEGSIAMIRHIPSLDYVVPVAIGHHERWDGAGYPRGLTGEDIPIGARCLCLADSFDAMTTKRPYCAALSVEEALIEIDKNLGTQFDPELGKVFVDLVKNKIITRPKNR
jgi:diguanylate cyclase (GGDEF) domain/uncharacterized domain HDIG